MFSIIFLGALCFGTAVEALQTIAHSDHLDVMHQPVYICILAGIDFLVWCFVFRWIGGYTFHQRTAIEGSWLRKHPHYPCPNSHELKEDQQKRKSFFDDPRHDSLNLSRDLAPCFILIVTCLMVYLIDQNDYPNAPKYVDPIMALLTIGFLVSSSVPMLKKASLILLQSLPEEMEDVEILCADLKSSFSKYIKDLHEVHVWCLVPNKIYATLHIVFKDEESYLSTLSDIHPFLLKYGINHATIQPEFDDEVKDSIIAQNSIAPSAVSRDVEKQQSTGEKENTSNLIPKESTVSLKSLDGSCHLACPPKSDCIKKRCCVSKEADAADLM